MINIHIISGVKISKFSNTNQIRLRMEFDWLCKLILTSHTPARYTMNSPK